MMTMVFFDADHDVDHHVGNDHGDTEMIMTLMRVVMDV